MEKPVKILPIEALEQIYLYLRDNKASMSTQVAKEIMRSYATLYLRVQNLVIEYKSNAHPAHIDHYLRQIAELFE